MMSPEARLVHMVNQIAKNLVAQGEARAVLAVADHIAAFWDPRMRARLLAMTDAPLDPVARAAVDRLRTHGAPAAPATEATRFANAAASGGSDAG